MINRAATLAAYDVTSSPDAALRLYIEADGAEVTDTVVPGLTTASTVNDVVAAINASFGADVTAAFVPLSDKIEITSNRIGSARIIVYDEFTSTDAPHEMGMATCVFGGPNTVAGNDWTFDGAFGATPGTNYDAEFALSPYGFGRASQTATFTPNLGDPYSVDAELGSYDAGGAFYSNVDTETGYYTAVQVNDLTHQFVWKTANENTGLSVGNASFTAIDGVRDYTVGGIDVTQGPDQQAGHTETLTVSVDTTDNAVFGGKQNAINGVRVKLPAGFQWPAVPSVALPSEFTTYTISGDTLTATGGQYDILNNFVVNLSLINATQSNFMGGVYPLEVSVRNVGAADGAWSLAKTQNLTVTSENKVKAVGGVTMTATEINAGGFSDVTGHLWDKYNNEIIEWGRGINFAYSGVTPNGSMTPSSIATGAPNSPFDTVLHTSTNPGINTVTATVMESETGTPTVSGSVSVDTRNVGEPYQVLLNVVGGRTSYATTETPQFFLKIVDNSDPQKGTSFSSGRWLKVTRTNLAGETAGDWPPRLIWVDAGHSQSDVFDWGSPGDPDTWTLTATDWFGGAMIPSPIRTVTFSDAVAPGLPYELAVTAVKPIPGQSMSPPDYPETAYNGAPGNGLDKKSFGYAAGNGTDTVEFTAQVVDPEGTPIHQAGIDVTMTIPPALLGYEFPGVLSETTATTDADGVVKVSVTSTVGSRRRLFDNIPDGSGTTLSYFSPVSFETTLTGAANDYGFAYFYRGILRPDGLTSDKDYILANGTDTAHLTAEVTDQAFGMPVEGWPINFTTTAGSLTPTSAVTDADGKAVVNLTSDSITPTMTTVVAVDQDGNSASADVNFSDLVMSVEPVGSGTTQGGYGAYQDVRVSFARLNGDPVTFDNLSFDDLGFVDDLGDRVGSLEWQDDEMAGDGSIAASIYRAQLEDPHAEGTFSAWFSNATVTRSSGIFGFSDTAPQTAQTDLEFVNNATFAATVDLGTWDSTVEGSAFRGANSANEELWGRESHVFLDVLDTQVHIGDVNIDPDGTVDGGGIDALDVPTYLPNGTYDVRVDGLLFTDALTVTRSVVPTLELTVFAPTAGQRFSPGSTMPVLVGTSHELQSMEIWIDSVMVWSSSLLTPPTGAHSIDLRPFASGDHTLTVKGLSYFGGEDQVDVAFEINTPSAGTVKPVYRFLNLKNGSHFYTITESEKNNTINNLSATYRFEGVAYSVNTANPDNSAPLYRFFNKINGTHFYTASESEKNNTINNLSATYKFEGVAWKVCSTNVAGSTPVYRFFNKTNGSHFYTASESEKNNTINNLSATFNFDGTAYYLAP